MKRTVAAILLLAVCASLFACTARSPVYASLGKYEITEAMYEYWLSYYKSRFYASLSEYGLITGDYDESSWQLSPDGERTLGEQVKDHVDEQIRQMLVCSVLYDEKGFGDDADTKALLSSTVEEFLSDDISAAGSRAELNGILAGVGCNINTLRRILEFEARAMIVADRLFGDGGTYAVTDAERETYYQDNYHRVKHIIINNSYKYVLDDNGEPKMDIYTGRYVTEELTGEEKAEKQNLAQSLYERAAAGEDFEALIEEYGEDTSMSAYTDGYFITASSSLDTVYLTAAITSKIGEVTLNDTSYGLVIMKKYPLQPGAWSSEVSGVFFTDMDSSIIENKKTEIYGKRYGEIEYSDFSPVFSDIPLLDHKLTQTQAQ